MSSQVLSSIQPDARDALDRFSFGNPQVHKLLADLAADRARLEDSDCITEAHVIAAARTLATAPQAASPEVAGDSVPRQAIGHAAKPRRQRTLPAWLAEPVETYGAIVLALGVVATAGWVALGHNEAPSKPTSPPASASQAAPTAPALAEALPAVAPAPEPLVFAPMPVPPAAVPGLPGTASVEDPMPLPIPPRKLPAPPLAPRNPASDPATTPAVRKHYLVRAVPRGERDPLPPRERFESGASVAAASPPPMLSAFQSMVQRFSGASDAALDNPRPVPQQRFIGSYVMGPNGTRQFVPDP